MSNCVITIRKTNNKKQPLKHYELVDKELKILNNDIENNTPVKIGYIPVNEFYNQALYDVYGKRLIDIFNPFVTTKDTNTSCLININPNLKRIKKEFHHIKRLFLELNKNNLRYVDISHYFKHRVTVPQAMEIYDYHKKEDKYFPTTRVINNIDKSYWYKVSKRKDMESAILFKDAKVVSIISNVVILKCECPYQWEINYTAAILENIKYMLNNNPNTFYLTYEKDII